jgi:hypothetical protein
LLLLDPLLLIGPSLLATLLLGPWHQLAIRVTKSTLAERVHSNLEGTLNDKPVTLRCSRLSAPRSISPQALQHST